MDVKVIDLAREGMLLPPAPHLCQSCATDHKPEDPHNWQSMHWQYWFYGQTGRFPKVLDAFEHTTAAMRYAWKRHMMDMADRFRAEGDFAAALQVQSVVDVLETN